MLDGKANKYMSGGNTQREAFKKSSDGAPKKDKTDTKVAGAPAEEGEATTTITHHADGTHSTSGGVEHAPLGHALMSIHAEHGDGEGMHVHKHEGGVTSHHVGMDGVVEGPNEHASSDEAGEHMKQMLGDGGGNGAMADMGEYGADMAMAGGEKEGLY